MADYNAKIDVVVHRAESLIGVNAGGTSNPYITISIGTQSVATPHVAKTINPTYESSFSFTSCALPTILTIRAFNKLAYSDLEDPLGTATLTLFHMQPATTKTVQLSHGGNPNLSQHNSCGSVTISYEISQMPADAAAPPPATSAAPAGVVAAPPAAATPMPVPAAINIEGQAALPVPTSSNLISLNSSLSHHAMTSTGAVPAAAPPAAPQVGSVMATLSPSLTPPSLGAARTPENIIFANPPCAPPPPAMAPPPPMRVEGTADVVSYPIPSLAAAAAAQQQQQPMLMMANGNGSAAGFPSLAPPTAAALPSTTILNMDQFYANNTTHNESRVPVAPNTILGSPAPAVAGYPPVASPSATLLAPSSSSLHDGALLARSPAELATAPAPPSLLYPAAANAPVLSEVPLVAQTTYPAAAAPTAPRSPPLSSSASTSHATTPSSASFAQRSHFVAAMPPPVAAAPEAPAIAAPSLNAAAPSPPAVADVVAQQQQQKQQQPSRTSAQSPKRKVAHAITAGLQSSKTSSHSPTRTSKMAATAAGQPPRRSAATAAAATSSAIHTQQQAPHNIAAIYADREYLFSAAASGADLAIFSTLRTMDPLLSCGFAQCLDYAGRTLLHVAAWHGQLAVLQILLGPTPELPLVDLRALVAPQSGNTILHSAACGGQAAVAQWLRYSHPTAGPLLLQLRNKRGMTAAESAKEAGFDAVSRLLLA